MSVHPLFVSAWLLSIAIGAEREAFHHSQWNWGEKSAPAKREMRKTSRTKSWGETRNSSMTERFCAKSCAENWLLQEKHRGRQVFFLFAGRNGWIQLLETFSTILGMTDEKADRLTDWVLWIQNCHGVSLPWQGQTDIPRALLTNTVLFGHLWCCSKFTVRLTTRRSPRQSVLRNHGDIKRASQLSGTLESQRGFWRWRSISLGFPWDLRGFRCARMWNYSKNKALLKEGVFMFNSAGNRQDVYGDICWGSCGQVQVLRGYGNRWQERYLAYRTTGTARDKRSEKSSGCT